MARKILEVKKSIQRICDQHILGLVLTRTKSTLVWISFTHNLCIQSHINCAPSIVCLRLYGVSDMTNLLIADRTGDWSCRHLIVISAVWVPWGDIWQGYWWQPATLGCCQVFDSLQGEIERERERQSPVLSGQLAWLAWCLRQWVSAIGPSWNPRQFLCPEYIDNFCVYSMVNGWQTLYPLSGRDTFNML